MPFTLRAFPTECNFLATMSFDSLEKVIPQSQIDAVLTQQQAQTIRSIKLNMSVVVFLRIAANLYPDRSFGHVLQKLVEGSPLFGPEADYDLPGDSAIC